MKLNMKAVALLCSLGLVACGDDKAEVDTVPQDKTEIKVQSLPAGVHQVSVGSEQQPQVGQIYVATSGDQLLVLNQENERAEKVYYTDSTQRWVSMPSTVKSEQVKFLHHEPIANQQIAVNQMQGRYIAHLDGEQVLTFAIDASGQIASFDSTCVMTGKITPSAIPNSLGFSLSSKNCKNWPEKAAGYLVVDEQYQPAAFRMINTQSNLNDLWVYPEN
ncbi:hypothetical protein EC844_101179 [Acinetobacter calcoaceticus]|uniref:Lipoprotein n=1 Tax=Acinetobacter calcoaceticus TaxID=471 RepID=A0A4R1Y709_ACICA|nr:hypothetical protein EC844_101179 [Acinetobacter calcoaceticus]